jgi:hypothetical protein
MIFANPIGIKVGGREQRDIRDIFALGEQEYLSLAYSDTSRTPTSRRFSAFSRSR